MAAPAVSDPGLMVIAPAFDPAFYRAIYTDLPPDMDPFWHYRTQGWREARDPAPWFSTAGYLEANPDVGEAGLEPFAHFLATGRHEGRDCAASVHARTYLAASGWRPRPWRTRRAGSTPTARAAGAPPLDEQKAAAARAFDPAFYLAANPDVAQAGMDGFEHYWTAGWREGRDPTPEFSTRDYLEANPDVSASGVHPFAHWVLAGRAEGRTGRHDLGFRFDVIARGRAPEDRVADIRVAAGRIRSDPAARLSAALAGLSDVHITFSHDDYSAHVGGLQLCVRRESARVRALGLAHLHIHPAAPWPVTRLADEPGPLCVMLNGERVGVFDPADVARAMPVAPDGARRSFAIHSLLGHEPDQTVGILAAAGLSTGWFWLHDFASLCASFHLLRNDVEDCAAPPSGSPACGVCGYQSLRARHQAAHRRLFERLTLTVASPSRPTLDLWLARSDLPHAGTLILPHATLAETGPASEPGAPRPLRIAHLGMPTPLKGWAVFRSLAETFAHDGRYQFVQLGGRAEPGAPVEFHKVVVSETEPEAMQAAVASNAIDIALIWPLCRETFSFTAYEAVAGGAAVIAGPDSGNVAAFAAERGVGRVMSDEAALRAAFESGAVLELARANRRPPPRRLVLGGLTGDLLAAAG
jgi:hypothetical protein